MLVDASSSGRVLLEIWFELLCTWVELIRGRPSHVLRSAYVQLTSEISATAGFEGRVPTSLFKSDVLLQISGSDF